MESMRPTLSRPPAHFHFQAVWLAWRSRNAPFMETILAGWAGLGMHGMGWLPAQGFLGGTVQG